jgi:hypothetical protein
LTKLRGISCDVDVSDGVVVEVSDEDVAEAVECERLWVKEVDVVASTISKGCKGIGFMMIASQGSDLLEGAHCAQGVVGRVTDDKVSVEEDDDVCGLPEHAILSIEPACLLFSDEGADHVGVTDHTNRVIARVCDQEGALHAGERCDAPWPVKLGQGALSVDEAL